MGNTSTAIGQPCGVHNTPKTICNLLGFEQDEPRVLPVLSQKEQLATLVETLLLEIAAALVSGEVGDDEDHC